MYSIIGPLICTYACISTLNAVVNGPVEKIYQIICTAVESLFIPCKYKATGFVLWTKLRQPINLGVSVILGCLLKFCS